MNFPKECQRIFLIFICYNKGAINNNNSNDVNVDLISKNYRSASVHNLIPFIKLKKIIPEEIKPV